METALATAILGVVLIGLIGMIPSGTQRFQAAMDISLAAQISQRILHDAEESEFDTLIDKSALPGDPEGKSYCSQHFTFRSPRVTAPGWRYFDVQGSEIVTTGGELTAAQRRMVVYYVNVRIMPRAVLPTINESSSQVALLTVQVARNPGHLPLEFWPGEAADADSPERNLIKPGKVPLYTHTALIGRNQGR